MESQSLRPWLIFLFHVQVNQALGRMLEKAIAFEYVCWCECSMLPGQCDLILCAMDYLWETQHHLVALQLIWMRLISWKMHKNHLKREKDKIWAIAQLWIEHKILYTWFSSKRTTWLENAPECYWIRWRKRSALLKKRHPFRYSRPNLVWIELQTIHTRKQHGQRTYDEYIIISAFSIYLLRYLMLRFSFLLRLLRIHCHQITIHQWHIPFGLGAFVFQPKIGSTTSQT